MHRVASVIHAATLTDPDGDEHRPRVGPIEVLTNTAFDAANLWVCALTVTVELPLPLLETEACYGPLDDFLRIRGDMPFAPDPAAPVPVRVDVPQ